MVLSVCSRILGEPHDVEDAFQATFWILAARAKSIRSQESVASWLHGVALRVASRLRDRTARRSAKERKLAEMADRGIDPEVTHGEGDDLDSEALHQEVQRLPRQYREVIVLCYLQGMTQEAVAVRLGCPSSTVGVRLMRARAQLKVRLSRRGTSRPGGEVLAPLLLLANLRPVPDSLAASTTGLVMGTGHKLSSKAALVAAEVLRGMAVIRRVRMATVVLVATLATSSFGAGLAGVGPWSHRTARPPVATKDSASSPVVKQDSAPSRDAERDPESIPMSQIDPQYRGMVSVGAVPEPSSWITGLTAMLIIGGCACFQRGKARSRRVPAR